jgi:hypothetical protein
MRSKEHLFDVRCVERNIRKGLVKREDVRPGRRQLELASSSVRSGTGPA